MREVHLHEVDDTIGPGSKVFFCGQNVWGRGTVLKQRAPKGFWWVVWPQGWKKGKACERADRLTRDLSFR